MNSFKAILLSVGFLVNFQVLGLGITDQFNKTIPFDWSKIESNSINMDQLKSIIQRQPKIFESLPFININDMEEHLSSFHFFDYDLDGDYDIWYNGYIGAESDGLCIFQNQKGNYHLISQLLGSIREINQYQSKTTSFNLLNYSCCAGYVDHLQTFHFNDNFDSIYIVSDIAKIIYTPTINPDMEAVHFEVKQKEYYLRIGPEIIQYNEKPFEFDPIFGQNIAAVYKQGDRGTAYAKKTDTTGREWWLVIMEPKYDDKDLGLYYSGDNTNIFYAPMGWMSSKYLKVIK